MLLITVEVTGFINLGNPKDIVINEITDIVKQLTFSNLCIVHQVLPQDGSRRRRLDVWIV